MPPVEPIIAGLFRAGVFVYIVWVIAIIILLAVELLIAAVGIRFLAFAWHWLAIHKVQLERQELLWTGSTPAEVDRVTPDLLNRQRNRWSAVLAMVYLTPPLIILTTAMFALQQPVAWLLAFVLLALVILGLIVVFFA